MENARRATVGNVKALAKRLLSDSAVARRIRKNAGLGDSTGPLAIEHGGTGAQDIEGILRNLRFNNNARSFFNAKHESIEYRVLPTTSYGSAFINKGYISACAGKTDDAVVFPVLKFGSRDDSFSHLIASTVEITEDGVFSENSTTIQNLTTKSNGAWVFGNPVNEEDGSIRWVFEVCGYEGQGFNGNVVGDRQPSLVDMVRSPDGSIGVELLVTYDWTMASSSQRNGSVSVDEDGSMLLATSDYKTIAIVLISPDYASTIVSRSNLKGELPRGLFDSASTYFNVRASREGGVNVVQRYGSPYSPIVVFDDLLNIIGPTGYNDEIAGEEFYFNNYQNFPFGASFAHFENGRLRRYVICHDGQVKAYELSPIDRKGAFDLGGDKGMPIYLESEGGIWTFGRYESGSYHGIIDEYGNHSDGYTRIMDDYALNLGRCVFHLSAHYDSGDILGAEILRNTDNTFEQIGWIDA